MTATLAHTLFRPVVPAATDRAERRAHSAAVSTPLCEVPRQVWGPFCGRYIAAYASQTAPGRFIAYAKVFAYRPADYWDGTGLAKYATDVQWKSSASAVMDAVFIAQYALERRYGQSATNDEEDFDTAPAPLMVLNMG